MVNSGGAGKGSHRECILTDMFNEAKVYLNWQHPALERKTPETNRHGKTIDH